MNLQLTLEEVRTLKEGVLVLIQVAEENEQGLSNSELNHNRSELAQLRDIHMKLDYLESSPEAAITVG